MFRTSSPRSAVSARSRVPPWTRSRGAVAELGYPVVVRPSFTMGGLCPAAYDRPTWNRSPVGAWRPRRRQLLIEVDPRVENELRRLMRDHPRQRRRGLLHRGTWDPVGVHTGGSGPVAPGHARTDREYQRMRPLSIAILREVSVDTGGCSIQFAQDPRDGRLVVIEMNPQVSRSSAWHPKATGFPMPRSPGSWPSLQPRARDRQRDVPKETPACFRADAGLRRGQGAAFAFESSLVRDDTDRR